MRVKRKMATTLVLSTALVLSMLATFSAARPAAAAYDDPDTPTTIWPIDGVPTSFNDNAVVKWDDELLQTIRANPGGTGPVVTARAIAVLHTAIYDAWAAYDPVADGVWYTGKATGAADKQADKQKAISFAAYDTLAWLFPDRAGDYKLQMDEFGYDLGDATEPAKIGHAAADATKAKRGNDGSYQLNGYVDPTNTYKPINTVDQVIQRWRWQPLCVLTQAGVDAKAPAVPPPGGCVSPNYAVQGPYMPQWGNVTPFALDAAHQYTPPGPPVGNATDVATALKDTANLDDTKKVIAEYWADGPRSEFPPGHWALFAQAYSRKLGDNLDTDVKMFFTMGNALLDASISSWKAKYEFDFWRPTSAIRTLYAGKKVTSWLGPYKGYGQVDGSQWRPYQDPKVVTPPFPEYTSGHSTFSAAARITLTAFTGSDTFGGQITVKAGTSLFEPRTATNPGVPARDVVIKWRSFLDAADQAGMSRRYGGIHFYTGDRHGRAAGATIGYWAYDKAKAYWEGRIR